MQPTLLFDADGVLIIGEFFGEKLARDFNITPEATKEYFITSFVQCIEGTADLKETIAPHLKKWGWTGSTQDFLDYWFSSGNVIDIKIISLIQKLRARGIRCFVATNQEKYRAQYLRETMGLANWFDGFFASADLGYKKPKIEFYRELTKRAGITDLANTWFFDDTEANIVTAKEFGIQAHLYTEFETFQTLVKEQGWLK